MKQISKRRRQVLMLGAGAVATPAIAMPVIEGTRTTWTATGAEAVVSGRVVCAADDSPLAAAQIEIWSDAVRVTATTDGDGRYFAAVTNSDSQLNYRVTHQGHTTQVTQLRLSGSQQRRVTRLRDDAGVTRAAFEMALSLPTGVAAITSEAVTL